MTFAESYYVVRVLDTESRADTVVNVLEESGIRPVDTANTWYLVAEFEHRYSPALGDAFALATAAHVDGTLLVGADDEVARIRGADAPKREALPVGSIGQPIEKVTLT